MINELYHELNVYATGTDCFASLAWLSAKFAEPEYAAARRAAAHWQAADEPLRDALAAYLGISEPLPTRQCPVPRAIAADYQAALDAACELLASDDSLVN